MSRRTTNKKRSSKKKNEKKAPPPPPPRKKRSAKPKANEKPIVHSSTILGGIIFLVLAICSAISYFNPEGSLVAFFSEWVRGLLGWGFYLAAPAFAIGR